MPIAPTAIFVAEVVMRGQSAAGGSDAKNINFVFHFRRTGTSVDPTKAALESAFNTNIAAPILAALNARYVQTITDTRWMDDALDPYVSVARAGTGAITGDSLSTNQAAYLLHRSNFRGRPWRGSKHLGPMSESDVGDDVWNAGCLTRLAAVNTALLAGFTDSTPNTWKYCIVPLSLSIVKTNPTSVLNTDVTQGLVNKRVGTMAQRKVKSTY